MAVIIHKMLTTIKLYQHWEILRCKPGYLHLRPLCVYSVRMSDRRDWMMITIPFLDQVRMYYRLHIRFVSLIHWNSGS